MAARRRVAVITGSRAEYGLLRTVMQAVQAHKKLQLQVIASGMHLVRKFGHTINDITADGFQIDARVPMQSGRDTHLAQAEALAKGVSGTARALGRLRSDLVVVLGDRIEALAGALAASTTNRVLAHIHGGDVAPGHLDDAFRHSITKLAHLHFAATPDAGRRLIRLGEWPKHVHVVGAPGLDDLRSIRKPHTRWLADEFGFASDAAIALIVQHPVGRAPREEQRVMDNILDAVAHCGLCGLIVYPNSDAGHSGILRAIKKRRQNDRDHRWVSVASIPRLKFLQCLKAAQILVGNSSAGIIEAPSSGTPAVNVGPRQAGRLRGGRSVVDGTESTTAIQTAISKARRMRIRPGPPRRSRVYGNGRTGSKIAAILARPDLSDNIQPKRIRY